MITTATMTQAVITIKCIGRVRVYVSFPRKTQNIENVELHVHVGPTTIGAEGLLIHPIGRVLKKVKRVVANVVRGGSYCSGSSRPTSRNINSIFIMFQPCVNSKPFLCAYSTLFQEHPISVMSRGLVSVPL